MDARQLKARQIVADGGITRGAECYFVPSQSDKDRYRVVLDGLFPSCTCEDFELTGRPCKHMTAARLWRDAGHPPKPDFTKGVKPKPTPRAPRPTYRQDWQNYNKSQTTEKDWFLSLLADLCAGIEEPERHRPKGGRPRLPLRDVMFSAAYKVYSTVSGRRFMCDLRDAQAKGFISRAPSYNAIFAYLDDADLTPLLNELIRLSSLPLKSVETHFAVDSSGFSTSRFERWFDLKYGVTKEAAVWVKAHVMTGVLTNVITAVEILDQHANDSPQLPKLVKATATGFRIEQVSADKAYTGGPNFEAVDAVGGTLYAPFKRNATGRTGGLFEKMFHHFNLNRAEYLTHYHRRSNVESTFSMVKAKFRDHVRSKTDTAMVNEVLLKFLCHNLCCLVSAIHELGIDPVFWEGKVATAAILKFPGVG
jgi:transposase